MVSEIKRGVDFVNPNITEHSSIHPLWRTWLYYRTERPPTEIDIARFEEKQKILKQKIQEWGLCS
jgi:NADH:ubiquinone oxidoreductase subunit